MLYSNCNYKLEKKELYFGLLNGIIINNKEKKLLLPSMDPVIKGMNKDLSIYPTQNGKLKIVRDEKKGMFLLLTSSDKNNKKESPIKLLIKYNENEKETIKKISNGTDTLPNYYIYNKKNKIIIDIKINEDSEILEIMEYGNNENNYYSIIQIFKECIFRINDEEGEHVLMINEKGINIFLNIDDLKKIDNLSFLYDKENNKFEELEWIEI